MAPGREDNPGPVPPNIICCRWLYAAANTPKPVPMMQIAKIPKMIQMVLTPFLYRATQAKVASKGSRPGKGTVKILSQIDLAVSGPVLF